MTVDCASNAYITGYTNGSLGGRHAGGHDAFLTKFSGVPEPASLSLLGAGGLLLLRRRRA